MRQGRSREEIKLLVTITSRKWVKMYGLHSYKAACSPYQCKVHESCWLDAKETSPRRLGAGHRDNSCSGARWVG
jgi:hypothetical protein